MLCILFLTIFSGTLLHFLKKSDYYIFNLFFYSNSLFYCCSSTVVSIFSLPLSPTPPTLNPYPFWICPWVLYTCSLRILPLLSPITHSYLPSSYYQFVLNFNVSGYILLAFFLLLIMFQFRGEIIWYLSLTIWLISLSIMLSSPIHAVAKGISSFFLSEAEILFCFNIFPQLR